MKQIILLTIILIVGCNDNSITPTTQTTDSWVFVANEGDYLQNNGFISIIDDFGNIYETEFLNLYCSTSHDF